MAWFSCSPVWRWLACFSRFAGFALNTSLITTSFKSLYGISIASFWGLNKYMPSAMGVVLFISRRISFIRLLNLLRSTAVPSLRGTAKAAVGCCSLPTSGQWLGGLGGLDGKDRSDLGKKTILNGKCPIVFPCWRRAWKISRRRIV